jgi:hypothetical protein
MVLRENVGSPKITFMMLVLMFVFVMGVCMKVNICCCHVF